MLKPGWFKNHMKLLEQERETWPDWLKAEKAKTRNEEVMAETPEEVAKGLLLGWESIGLDEVTRAIRAQYVAGLEKAARYAETFCPLNASVSALDIRDAEWRRAVRESWHGITHWEGCPCSALHRLMEGRDAHKP